MAEAFRNKYIFYHSRGEIQKAVQKFIDWITTVTQMFIDHLCLQITINHVINRYQYTYKIEKFSVLFTSIKTIIIITELTK